MSAYNYHNHCVQIKQRTVDSCISFSIITSCQQSIYILRHKSKHTLHILFLSPSLLLLVRVSHFYFTAEAAVLFAARNIHMRSGIFTPCLLLLARRPLFGTAVVSRNNWLELNFVFWTFAAVECVACDATLLTGGTFIS
jgi:hypothetical protein